MFRVGRTVRMWCVVCLKFPCTARDVLWSRGGESYNNGTKGPNQRWQNGLKMTEYLWKIRYNRKKNVGINHVCFTVIANTISEKKLQALPSYRPSYLCRLWNRNSAKTLRSQRQRHTVSVPQLAVLTFPNLKTSPLKRLCPVNTPVTCPAKNPLSFRNSALPFSRWPNQEALSTFLTCSGVSMYLLVPANPPCPAPRPAALPEMSQARSGPIIGSREPFLTIWQAI
jgi:hypothetical protein